MIYTIGNREEYDKGIDEKAVLGERYMKRGMGQINGQIYRGGAVFLEEAQARAWIAARAADAELRIAQQPGQWPPKKELEVIQELGVYGVEADWDKHTMIYPEEEFRRLIVDRPLVKLDAVPQVPEDREAPGNDPMTSSPADTAIGSGV